MVQQETSCQLPVPSQCQKALLATGLALGTAFCYAVPQMWEGSRWTARFLVLVMLVSAFGPLTMASAPSREPCTACASHWLGTRHNRRCHAIMRWHRRSRTGLIISSLTFIFELRFRLPIGNCCQNDCCRGATTSEWAQPASHFLSRLSLLIEPARPTQGRASTQAISPEVIPPAPLLAASP